MERKKKREKKGFTLIEILVVVTILVLMLMVAIPTFNQTRETTRKNIVNTTHKIFLNAIDYWIRDNINPSQRPANFTSENSQGKTVLDYVSNREVYNITNLAIESGKIKEVPFKEGEREVGVFFREGVFTTTYMDFNSGVPKESNTIGITYAVYETDFGGKIKDYTKWVNANYIIEGKYKEATNNF